MTYRAKIDEDSCAGHGDCVEVAPEMFRLDGDIAEVIADGPFDRVLEAAEACPAMAVAVIEIETGEQLYP